MDEPHLYQKIATAIRREILSGHLKAGDRLPSIRKMMLSWECTPGTVQRAYQELAHQGLVTSHAGRGTHVVEKPVVPDDTPLRRAMLINRAEAFLLEVLTAGYSSDEIQSALQIAWDHWRIVSSEPAPRPQNALRFVGSHDPAVVWLAEHCPELLPQCQLQIEFSGSLGGLIALAQGKADIAGCHLWDAESDSYNAPFVRRLLPGRRVALLTLAHRRLGLIVPKGNPVGVNGLADLTRSDLRFVNRQSGSGTRVWLDANLHIAGIDPQVINGYEDERMTHSDVARAVAQGGSGKDDGTVVGFGLETAALSFDLDFVYLVHERYDLVIPEMLLAELQPLVSWLQSKEAQRVIFALGGYDTDLSGNIELVE